MQRSLTVAWCNCSRELSGCPQSLRGKCLWELKGNGAMADGFNTTRMNGIRLVLFHMYNGNFGPFLAAMYRFLISVMPRTPSEAKGSCVAGAGPSWRSYFSWEAASCFPGPTFLAGGSGCTGAPRCPTPKTPSASMVASPVAYAPRLNVFCCSPGLDSHCQGS
jgi:hypothetical protein